MTTVRTYRYTCSLIYFMFIGVICTCIHIVFMCLYTWRVHVLLVGEHQMEMLDSVAAKFHEEPGVFKLLVRHICSIGCIAVRTVHVVQQCYLQYWYTVYIVPWSSFKKKLYMYTVNIKQFMVKQFVEVPIFVGVCMCSQHVWSAAMKINFHASYFPWKTRKC